PSQRYGLRDKSSGGALVPVEVAAGRLTGRTCGRDGRVVALAAGLAASSGEGGAAEGFGSGAGAEADAEADGGGGGAGGATVAGAGGGVGAASREAPKPRPAAPAATAAMATSHFARDRDAPPSGSAASVGEVTWSTADETLETLSGAWEGSLREAP